MKHFVPVFVLALAVIAGCTAPVAVSNASPGGRSLAVSWGSVGRTIVPADYPTPDGYTVVLHPQTGSSGDVTATATEASAPTFQHLDAVVYDVEVTATRDGTTVATGTATADLRTEVSASVSVTLTYRYTGTGTGQIHLTFELGASGLDYTVVVESPSGQTANETLVNTGTAYTYTNTAAQVGTYRVSVRFTWGALVAERTESVLVVPTGDTAATVDLSEAWVTGDRAPTEVAFTADSENLHLLAGQDPVALSVGFTPENTTSKVVTWTSSNPAVATVTSDGRVEALAAGTTTITAAWPFDSSVEATTTVTVLDIGKTIYVGGNLDAGSPGYWKNGAWTPATPPIPNSAYHVSGIRVAASGDVYLSGTYYSAGGLWTAALWTNGVPATYGNGLHSQANTVVLDGTNNVYVGGFGRNTSATSHTILSWFNGTPTSYDRGSFDVDAWGLAVSGSSILQAGFNYNAPAVWKDGSPIILPKATSASGGAAYGIAISGTTVVAVGTFNDAYYWSSSDGGTTWDSFNTDTVLPRTTTGSTDVYASKVFLDGSDVYVSGCDGSHAVYWKKTGSGAFVEHDLGVYGQATSIVVANGHVLVTGTNLTPYLLSLGTTQTYFPGYGKAYLWVDGDLVTLATRTGTSLDCDAAEVWVP